MTACRKQKSPQCGITTITVIAKRSWVKYRAAQVLVLTILGKISHLRIHERASGIHEIFEIFMHGILRSWTSGIHERASQQNHISQSKPSSK
jgi:hypothetical protein